MMILKKMKFSDKNLSTISRCQLFTGGGFSLVEALLSISIFSLLITAFVGSIIYGQESERLSGERARATFIAEEGLEAVRNIRDANFEDLVPGTYGLEVSGGQWNFSGSSDVTDIFTRSVNISDADANTKTVTSNVEWKQNEQRDGSVSLTTQMTNWKKIRLTEAEQFEVDTSNSRINPSNTDQVIDMTIENIGTDSIITIAQMQVSWTGGSGGSKITDISINGNSVWTGNNASGGTEDITDFALDSTHGTYPIDYLDFSKDMTGSTITIIFTMLDGSIKQVVFSPGAPPDATPPSNITNLSTSNTTINSVDLSWTAPGDDGNIGTASSYDIRYSTSTITESNWSSAFQISGEPIPQIAGTSQSMSISGLSSSTTYYFAIKTSDEMPNTSGISNIASVTTLSPPQANYLLVNTIGAQINPVNNRQLIGITLQNSGSSNITVASMTVSWSGIPGNRRLNTIRINNLDVWTGTATSGTVENIADVILISGATAVPINYFQFSNTITGITMNIIFTMTDGSTKTVSGIVPL